jgi:glutaredoxin
MISCSNWKHKKSVKRNRRIEDIIMAMKTSLDPYIYTFASETKSVCAHCNSTKDLMVDHVIDFQEIVYNFSRECKSAAPLLVDSISKRVKCFKLEDNEFELEWIEYHQANAILLVVCGACSKKIPEFEWQ